MGMVGRMLRCFIRLNGKWLVLRSTGSGFSVQTWTSHVVNSDGFAAVGADIDGDGDTDLAMAHLAHGPWLLFRSDGVSFKMES